MNLFSSALVARLIDLALEEDLAFGDVTSALLDWDKPIYANILSRQDLVVCGLPLTEKIISRAGYSISVETKIKEGEQVKTCTVLQVLSGSAREITGIERIVLNFLQRLCGVASFTREIINHSHGLTILDTRKTMPGFRLLDKYATRVGGARNHRMHLGEMILVKNNHIDSAKGATLEEKVKTVLSSVQNRSGYYIPWQVEVRSEQELNAVLDFKPSAVLLDNMDDNLLASCLALVKAKSPTTLCEASGGINEDRLKKLASLGVNAASMGKLTTHAPNVDISLRIVSV